MTFIHSDKILKSIKTIWCRTDFPVFDKDFKIVPQYYWSDAFLASVSTLGLVLYVDQGRAELTKNSNDRWHHFNESVENNCLEGSSPVVHGRSNALN